MSDYEKYLLQQQAERKPSFNDMTLDERMTEYIEWQNTDFDRDLMVDAHLEIINLRAENARLAAAHEAAADELARVVRELREAAYLLAKIDADMGMDDDGDLFCYFDSSFARKIEDMAQKYKPE